MGVRARHGFPAFSPNSVCAYRLHALPARPIPNERSETEENQCASGAEGHPDESDKRPTHGKYVAVGMKSVAA